MCHECTKRDIKIELDRLGLDADLIFSRKTARFNGVPETLTVKFKNQEDLNFYKLASKFDIDEAMMIINLRVKRPYDKK